MPRSCAHCGEEFIGYKAHCPSCRLWARRHDGQLPALNRPCIICGAQITGRRDREVCSTTCRNRRLVRDPVLRAERQRRYRANRKARGLPANTWSPALRDAYHRRRAAKAGGELGLKVHYSEIAERDGWICQLCFVPVEPELAWPQPASGSIDHVVPLSIGGRHDPSNVQLAHLRCNTAKGATPPGGSDALLVSLRYIGVSEEALEGERLKAELQSPLGCRVGELLLENPKS